MRKNGEADIAKQVRTFTQELQKTQYSTADKKIEQIRGLIEKELGHDFVEEFNDSLKETEKFNLSDKVKGFFTLGGLIKLVQKAYKAYKDFGGAYIDFIENQNLFEVQMGRTINEYGKLDQEASKYYTRAINFQKEMNKHLLTNQQELMNYQAMYYSMFESQGINKDVSYLLSENLTKAGYDMASLFNMGVDEAMYKLQSAIAGQPKGLREKGIDITESSLQTVLDSVGITRSVQQLSYAEKEIARYIAIVRQASEAQGDFARTIDSPSNQLKILTNQFEELKQVAGAFVVNIFGRLIKYASAVIMALKEILKYIGAIFNINFSDSGNDTMNMSKSLGLGEVNDGLAGATAKAKEFKKQLLGFDEINNITPESQSGGGTGGIGGVGGIDNKLLDAITEWDNKMGDINSKAAEIRDKILEAYGFTRDENGELQWSWDNANKGVLLITGLLGALTAYKLISKTISLASGIKGLWDKLTGVKKATEGINTSAGKVQTTLGKIMTVAAGLVGLGISDYLSYDSMKKLANGTQDAATSFLELAGGIAGAAGSGAMIGSVFGPVGTAIGAVAGAATAGIAAWFGYSEGEKEAAEEADRLRKEHLEELYNSLTKTSQEYDKLVQAVKEGSAAELDEVNNVQFLRSELDKYVDANGKIKEGYEDRVTFITGELKKAYGIEVDIIDDTIQKYGDYKKAIDDLIKSKEEEIAINKISKDYENAKNTESDLKKELTQNKEIVQGIANSINKLNNTNYSAEELYKGYVDGTLPKKMYAFQETILDSYKVQYDAMKKSEKALDDNMKAQERYYEWSIAETKGSEEEKAEIIYKSLNNINDMSEKSLQENVTVQKNALEEQMRNIKESGGKMTDAQKNTFSKMSSDLARALTLQKDSIMVYSKDSIEAWKLLAEADKDAYKSALSTLPDTARLVIETATGTVSAKSPETIAKWKELADKSKTAYQIALSSLPTDTANTIKKSVNSIGDQESAARNMVKKITDTINNTFKNNLSSSTASNSASNFIKGFTNKIDDLKQSVYNKVQNVGEQITKIFNRALGNHSPSKITNKSAFNFLEGFNIGIDNNEDDTFKQIRTMATGITKNFEDSLGISSVLSNLNGSIKVNTRRAMVENQQQIEYGNVSTNIQNQSVFSLNEDLTERIVEAVRQGMSSSNVDVHIEAKTDEGVIVKKAASGFSKYVTKTGKLPFPVPIGGF